MEEQAGIYRFTFYEAKELSFIRIDDNTVRFVSNLGEVIEIENSDCNTIDLGYTFEHQRSGNNKLTYKNTLTWKQLGLNGTNLALIDQLKQSIYGWVPVIEFYNNTQKIIENPFRFVNSSIDNNVSNHYNIELKNVIFGKRIKDYTPFDEEANALISTDVPGENIPDSFVPDENTTIHLN